MKKLIFNLLNKFQENRLLHSLLHKYSNNGVIEEEASEKDWIFGMSDADKIVLREDGQWDDYMPAIEVQKKGVVETMACVSFSLNNVIEFLAKRKYDEEWNKSDRFTAKMANTTRRGNSMKRVIDAVRHNGMIDEERWAFDENLIKTWNDYYAPVDLSVREWAKEFLNRSEVQYDTIFNRYPQALMEALKYSPVWTAGYAWGKDSNGLYHSWGGANHAFLIYGYEYGKYWKVFDSYSPYKKRLAWNFKFYYPKTVYLVNKNEKFNTAMLIDLKKNGTRYVMRPHSHGEIYKITDDFQLKHVEKKELVEELRDELKDKEAIDDFISYLSKQKKLLSIPEPYYEKLIKN